MSSPGMGVMLGMLAGNGESVEIVRAALGKTITSLSLVNDNLRFVFEDGSTMTLSDQGQSCCESRYMRTDDDLAYYVGAQFMGAEVKDAPSIEDQYGEHEVQFLDVNTSRGTFQMASHNEHNGYYGGFWIQASK